MDYWFLILKGIDFYEKIIIILLKGDFVMRSFFKQIIVSSLFLTAVALPLSDVDAIRPPYIGERTGLEYQTVVNNRYSDWQKNAVYKFLGDYDFRRGQAIRLFPNTVWNVQELEYFLKHRCNAIELLDSQGITDKWVRFRNKTCIYKFIDDNIDYFRQMYARRSVMKTLISNGVHLESDSLTEFVNIVKSDLGDLDLADETFTDHQKWEYLEQHRAQIRPNIISGIYEYI